MAQVNSGNAAGLGALQPTVTAAETHPGSPIVAARNTSVVYMQTEPGANTDRSINKVRS
jgi:hypothetical protein